MDKGKAPMIVGSSNALTQNELSLSYVVEKFKEKMVGEVSAVVKRDLLPKFAVADCEPDVLEISHKGPSSASKRESPNKDEDEMNMPLKLLKKTVKVEKL